MANPFFALPSTTKASAMLVSALAGKRPRRPLGGMDQAGGEGGAGDR